MKTNLTVILRILFLSCLYFTSQAQTSGYSGTGANIDVKFIRAEWVVDPRDASKTIAGSVTTYFTTVSDNVNQITLDLNKASFDNSNLSVSYHGSVVASSFPTTANILRINLPVVLPLAKFDSITVNYSGIPPGVNGAAEGYQRLNDAGAGNYVYTLSESYEDRDWWPCKADMQDRIDSSDYIITVPWAGTDTFWVACHGKLVSATILPSNQRKFHFKHRYPIPTYLIALGIARFDRYHRTPVNIGGSSVPVEYNIFTGKSAAFDTSIVTALDKSREEMIQYSNLFGDYPFKDEKHGYYEFGFGGGMEHQTFSGMGTGALTDWSVIAHELAHQWFGNKVTFATWNHLWLAEGFAKYLEALAAEKVPSLGQSAVDHRRDIKGTALYTSTTPIYLSNTSIANSNTIWTGSNTRAVYQRGAVVISMLRKLSGDTRFFQACRNYLNDPALAYKSATTDDLKRHFEAVLNYDLDPFFTDYVYGVGNPAYDVSWGTAGNNINIELTTQRRSGTTISYYRTPVVLRILGATKDTTVVIYDQNGSLSYAGNGISTARTGKILGYRLSFAPVNVQVDPYYETMVRGQDGVSSATNQVAASSVGQVSRLNYNPTIVLPINVVEFKVIEANVSNKLHLQLTASSEVTKAFVERSLNGTEFRTIGSLHAKEVTGSNINFIFSDADVADGGRYYYRVRMIDGQGKVEYTKLALVERRSHGLSLLLHPNPAQKFLHVVLSGSGSNRIRNCFIYNAAGVCVKNIYAANSNSLNLDVSNLPTGNYSIKVTDAKNSMCSGKFSISR